MSGSDRSNIFPWPGTMFLTGGAGASGIAAITGGVIANTAISGGTIDGTAITNSTMDGTSIGAYDPDTGRFTSLEVLGLSTLGRNSANYITVAGGATGSPVTLTAVGGDAAVDARWVLPGRGLLSVPRALVGTHSAGSGIASPRLFTLHADQTISGPGQATRVGGILRGTSSSSFEGYYVNVLDEDRLAFTPNTNGMTINYYGSTLRAGWSGGRVLLGSQLYVGDPNSPGTGAGQVGNNTYHVSGASFAYSYTEAGGGIGAYRGNLFARNEATRLRAGSGYFWNSTFGQEIDVGVTATSEVLWKGGLKVVQWADDANRGLVEDFAYGINSQAGGTAPGWRHGFALGGVEGWWPFTASSTLMGVIDGIAGGPAVEMAAGINLTRIAIGESAFKSPGFRVSGAGAIGALATGGVEVQTRSSIVAATSVVASVDVLEGGLFAGTVTLTGTAPPGSGTTATFVPAQLAIPYANSTSTDGSGYAVGDTVTVSGGTYTQQASGVVTKVGSGGEIRGVKFTTPGVYTVLPSSPVSTTTSGAGSGWTFVPQARLLSVTVSNPGTNYGPNLPPEITSAGSLSTLRPATLRVNLTPTQVPLQLNNGKVNVTGIPTSSAGLASGDVYSNAGVLTVVP